MSDKKPSENEALKKRIDDAESLLAWIDSIGEYVMRISSIVQDNPSLFRAKLGESTIKAAAEFLEKCVLLSKVEVEVTLSPEGDFVRVEAVEVTE